MCDRLAHTQRVDGEDYVKVLTVREAATALRVCDRSVYSWLRRGDLPGRKIGGTWRISESQLSQFLAAEPKKKAACHGRP